MAQDNGCPCQDLSTRPADRDDQPKLEDLNFEDRERENKMKSPHAQAPMTHDQYRSLIDIQHEFGAHGN